LFLFLRNYPLQEGGLATARLRSIQVSFGSDCRDYGADQYYPAYMICAGGGNQKKYLEKWFHLKVMRIVVV
jgi:hypothetical protein